MDISVVTTAANIRTGGSDRVVSEDFLAVYPQFGSAAVPQIVLDMCLDRANAAIQESRWHSAWRMGVCLYAAHMITMWMKTAASADEPATAIVHKGDSNGALSSKSVGGVSVSYGSTAGDSDLAGFGNLRDTIFGQQLASLARMAGKGMMVVR